MQTTTPSVLTEDVLSLSEARAVLAEMIGRQPDQATLYRWCLRGVGGVRLDHVRVGGRLLTSRQALQRFIADRTGGKR